MEEADRISRSFSPDQLTNRESSGATTSSSIYSRVLEEVGVPFEHHNQVRHPESEPNDIGTSYRGNYFAFDNDSTAIMRDDTWSCVIVLLTFWFFVSMTLILGVYGSLNILLGPSCSILLQPNPIFVQSIKLELISEIAPGPMLYGFYDTPPLDAVSKWSETHNVSLPTDSHKESLVCIWNSSVFFSLECIFFKFVAEPFNIFQEWTYYLNKESQINVSYDIYPSSTSIFLIIAQGSEGLAQWFEDPTYPNTTLSWNFIEGSGIIRQSISKSSTYYVAVGNLNSEKVKVQLNLSVRAYIYNTTNAYYKCTFAQDTCSMTILFPKGDAAVLTSPIPGKGAAVDGWSVKLSYGPRWVTYIIGIGGMTSLMFLVFNFLDKFRYNRGNRIGTQYEARRPDRAPLLSQKDDDISSWGSSYDSVSQDDKDLEDFLVVGSKEGKSLGDVENSNNTRRLCAICFDAPRDCFFLPCGHCVACFACGTRIAEADGTCPICRRNMKKVRKIFTV